VKMQLTLTVAQIIDLAEFAGLDIDPRSLPDEDGMTTELSIGSCPEQGLLDDEDDTTGDRYEYIAWFTEHPEEGATGLGPELHPITSSSAGPADPLEGEAGRPPAGHDSGEDGEGEQAG